MYLGTKECEVDVYRLAKQRDGGRKDVQQVRVINVREGNVLTGASSVFGKMEGVSK